MTSTITTGSTKAAVDLRRGEFTNEPFIDFSSRTIANPWKPRWLR